MGKNKGYSYFACNIFGSSWLRVCSIIASSTCAIETQYHMPLEVVQTCSVNCTHRKKFKRDCEICSLFRWVCVCAWSTLLTLQYIGHHCYIHWPIMTNLAQDYHWVCPHMSHDFNLCLTSDLDIGVNAKFGGYIFLFFPQFYLFMHAVWQRPNNPNFCSKADAAIIRSSSESPGSL